MDELNFIVPISIEAGKFTACPYALIAHYAERDVSTEEIMAATGPVVQKVGYLIRTNGNENVYGDPNYIAQLYAEQFRADQLKELWRGDMLYAS